MESRTKQPKNHQTKLNQTPETVTKGWFPGGRVWGVDEEGKGNIVNNIVINLHGDRLLLELWG